MQDPGELAMSADRTPGPGPSGGDLLSAAGFVEGDEVRVRDDWPEQRGPAHIRTPHYLRGLPGSIVRLLGRFANPEDLAFDRPAAQLRLFHVRFRAADVWPDTRAGDDLLVEIFEHWLEPRR